MKKSFLSCLIALSFSPLAFSASYKVDIQNLTRGTFFAPVLVAAHPATAGPDHPRPGRAVLARGMPDGGQRSIG